MFNIHNAAMAISAARFYGVPLETIQRAVASFEGVKRRQEVRGEKNGIKVIDDFGHHPTAIRETLSGLRQKYPGGRLWAVFEPRSNTTRRAIFQHELPRAFDLADGVILAKVAKLEQIPEGERLDPERVIADIAASGRPAFYEPDAEQIIARLEDAGERARHHRHLQQRRVRQHPRPAARGALGMPRQRSPISARTGATITPGSWNAGVAWPNGPALVMRSFASASGFKLYSMRTRGLPRTAPSISPPASMAMSREPRKRCITWAEQNIAAAAAKTDSHPPLPEPLGLGQ